MSKVKLIKLAKALKKKIKKAPVPYVSYCRKIERIKTSKRICAMTFDDGPTYADDITKTLVETLNEFGAKGTFDIIGTTEHNYPDFQGKIGTPSWSGVKFDHYPSFDEDKKAGAINTPELVNMIISSGHEITNHTYSHVLFGKKNIIYSKRHTLSSFEEVYEDVEKLHDYLKNNFNYEMRFSRPPHYVDRIKGGFTSYDVYSKIGYNYLCASFDGAGWLPAESEEAEVEAMVSPLKKALEENPDALNGQIIFQKDGYNMSLRAPVKKGLKRQLQLLKDYGYEIVTVSQLMEESPLSDVSREDSDFEAFAELQKNRPIVFNDNTLRPDIPMKKGELAMLISPKSVAVNERIVAFKTDKSFKHPYSNAMKWSQNQGYINGKIDETVTKSDIEDCEHFFDVDKITSTNPTRRDILLAYKNIF